MNLSVLNDNIEDARDEDPDEGCLTSNEFYVIALISMLIFSIVVVWIVSFNQINKKINF